MTKKFTAYWFDAHIPKFTNILSHLAGKDNIHGLEIGSFEGRSSCWFLDNIFTHKTSTLTCIDTWKGSPENSKEQCENLWEIFQQNIKHYEPSNAIVKRGLSRTELKKLDNKKYDFIYIDGSHTTRDVLEDAVLAFDLLKIEGIMTFDDYQWTGFSNPLLNPTIGINSFLSCYELRYELIEKNHQVSIKKICE